jgi:hypothetical protein
VSTNEAMVILSSPSAHEAMKITSAMSRRAFRSRKSTQLAIPGNDLDVRTRNFIEVPTSVWALVIPEAAGWGNLYLWLLRGREWRGLIFVVPPCAIESKRITERFSSSLMGCLSPVCCVFTLSSNDYAVYAFYLYMASYNIFTIHNDHLWHSDAQNDTVGLIYQERKVRFATRFHRRARCLKMSIVIKTVH